MKVKIEKLDHQGRGIAHYNNKIIFIPNALKDEEVDIKIIKESNKYMEGSVIDYIKKSPKRVISKCPYFNICGGCNLLHMTYLDTLEYKKNKLKEILSKYAGIENFNIEVIENTSPFNYRNKISIKIKDYNFGFYETSSHNIVNIKECLIAKESINDVIKCLNKLKIKNGSVVIRSNYNDEILINIITKDKIDFNINYFSDIKLVGILLNNKIIYGEDNFMEKINNLFFKVSYNSFFQINSNITSKVFDIISDNINKDNNVLDLYCGVGTLGIISSKKAKQVTGVEIIPNAIKDALINAKINKSNNIKFILGDINKVKDKINIDYDTLIIDPPREGLNKEVINYILDKNPKNIIYMSCNPMTISRDLKLLTNNYKIEKIYLLDMFSYTYHIESILILNRK